MNESLSFDETMDLANLVKKEMQDLEDDLSKLKNKSKDSFDKPIYDMEEDTENREKRIQEKLDLWQAVYGKLTSGFRRVHTKINTYLSDEEEVKEALITPTPVNSVISGISKLQAMPKEIKNILKDDDTKKDSIFND